MVKRGGKREGSGRKPLPDHERKTRRIFWVNDAERETLRATLHALRRQSHPADGQGATTGEGGGERGEASNENDIQRNRRRTD